MTRRRLSTSFLLLCSLMSAGAFGSDQETPSVDSCPVVAGNAADRWDGQQQWQALEDQGFRIRRIIIQVDDVYDSPEDERRWFEDVANALHLDSSDAAIRAAVILEPGELVDAERIYQSERNLRGLRFLLDAWVEPYRCSGKDIDILVRVHDAWTLTLSVGFSSVGGQSRSSIRLEDHNFLGTGKTVKLDRTTDPERTTTEFTYRDPNLFGSQWAFEGTHQSLSDGRSNFGILEYPFRSFDQPWAFRLAGGDTTSELYFYDLGETAWTANSIVDEQDILLERLLGYEGDNGWRGGIGWHFEDHRYFDPVEITPGILPEPVLDDRQLSGGYLRIERFHEHYASFSNVRAMSRHEDYNLGFNISLLLGNYSAGAGNQDNALFVGTEMSYGSTLGGYGLFLFDGEYGARHYNGGVKGGKGELLGDAYFFLDDASTLVAHLKLGWLDNPDPEQQLYIGGLEGLYGYPDHLRQGDISWQSQLEYRYTTDAVLFKTLRVGYTAFLQTAQVQQLDNSWSRAYSNVGVGFRLGNLRGSTSNTIYIGIARPLVDAPEAESWQFFISDKITF